MKYMNYIKLLSVLLCIVVLFAACAPKDNDVEDGTADSSETESQADTDAPYVPVDPVLSNFFNFEYEQPWVVLSEATRMDGEIVSSTDDNKIFVLRDTDVDAMNVVTEIYKVYNSELGKVVLTFTNTYDNGRYDPFDWENFNIPNDQYPEVKYPSNVLDVAVNALSMYVEETDSFENMYFIMVSRATVTEIDEDVREENDYGNFYDVVASYEYYDVTGQKITDAKTPLDVYSYASGINEDGTYLLSFGTNRTVFDLETMKLISVTDEDNQKLVGEYDYQNDKYGYCLNVWDYQPLGYGISYIDVIDKATNEVKYRHYYSADAYDTSAFVLDNGNILIQEIRMLPYDTKKTPDYVAYTDYLAGDAKYTVNTYIFDIKTGEAHEIEFNYLVSSLMQNDAMEERYDLDDIGVTITDNALNITIVNEIKDGRLERDAIVVFNNDMSVIFKLDRFIPDHIVGTDIGFGMKVLPTGDYLVNVYNQDAAASVEPVEAYAIVTKDGVVRSYLPIGAVVAGEYVVIGNEIYDYDMNSVFDLSDVDDDENAYQYVTSVGGKIIISQEVTKIDRDSFLPTTVKIYYSLAKGENGIEKNLWIEGAEHVATTDDYVIMIDADNGKYTLYNAELEHILTTQGEMTIYACEDGKYIVSTTVTTIEGSHQILYVVK